MEVVVSPEPTRRMLRIDEVLAAVGMKRSWLYREISNGNFVQPVKIGRASRWDSLAVAQYIAALADGKSAGACK